MGPLENPLVSATRALPSRPDLPRRDYWRLWPAFFAGCNLRVLADLDDDPEEQSFFVNLGLVSLMLSCVSGLAFACAMSTYFVVPLSRVWWSGLLWTSFLAFGLERLVLRVSAGRRRLVLIPIVLQRLAISALIAVAVADPVVLLLNRTIVNRFIATQATTAVIDADNRLQSTYGQEIAQDQQQISGVQAHIDKLQQQIAHYKFLKECEIGTIACSQTHRTGCGAYCQHDGLEAQILAGQLTSYRQETGPEVSADETAIKTARRLEAELTGSENKGIQGDRGLPEQEHALAAIASHDSTVADEIWFLRIACLILDLTPLTAKLIKLLCGSRYEDELFARSQMRLAKIVVKEEGAFTDIHRARVRGRADREMVTRTSGLEPTPRVRGFRRRPLGERESGRGNRGL
jgi:hypothetical protein